MNLKAKEGLSVSDMIVVGFALFSMFFGAGNTVFPPYIGMESGSSWFTGFLMFFIGDCGLALMGCFALLRMGSTDAVFNRLGATVGKILVAICLLCVGPFIAVPRTAATTYELGIAPNISGIPTVLFSVIFFVIVLALTIKQTAVVDIVGKILTPLLLLGLAVIIIMGIIHPIGEITAAQIENVAGSGLKNGYQTLDAIGAVPTGMLALQSIMAKNYSKKKETATMAGASIVCGVLLLLVYMGLAYLGATVSGIYTSEISRSELILAIVYAIMGKAGTIIFGIVVGLACLTTAIGLTGIVGGFFSETIFKGKVSYKLIVIVMCVFSAVVSNLGLDRIISIAGPILDLVYPPVVTTIFISVAIPFVHDYISRFAAGGALVWSALCSIDAMTSATIGFLHKTPFFEVGLSWIIPTIICGLIGFAVAKATGANSSSHAAEENPKA